MRYKLPSPTNSNFKENTFSPLNQSRNRQDLHLDAQAIRPTTTKGSKAFNSPIHSSFNSGRNFNNCKYKKIEVKNVNSPLNAISFKSTPNSRAGTGFGELFSR